MSSVVTLGSSSDIFYLDALDAPEHHDVCFVSSSGKKFGINKAVLAACSGLWRSIFHNQIQYSNHTVLDKEDYVMTNFTNEELHSVMLFCKQGLLPLEKCADGEKAAKTVSHDYIYIFHLFGVDVTKAVDELDRNDDATIVKQPCYSNEVPFTTAEATNTRSRKRKAVVEKEKQVKEDQDWYEPKQSRTHQKHHQETNGAQLFPAEVKQEYLEPDEPTQFLSNVSCTLKNESDNDFEDASYSDYEDEGSEQDEPLVCVKKVAKKKPAPAPAAKKKPKSNKKLTPAKLKKVMAAKDLFDFPESGTRDLSKPFHCRRCITSYDKVKLYRQHFLRHDLDVPDPSKAWTCTRCFAFNSDTYGHVFKHSKQDCTVQFYDDQTSRITYFCAFCEKDFNTCRDYLEHLKDLHPKEWEVLCFNFECAACGKMNIEKTGHLIHKKEMGPHHTNYCVQCNEEIKSWSHYQRHVMAFHQGKMMYLCGHCGTMKFDDMEEYKTHKRTCRRATAIKGKTCDYCDVEITLNPRETRKHLVDCHPEVLISCTQCDHRAVNKKALEAHIYRMHGAPGIECDICGKSIPSATTLKQHLRSHTENKRFHCQHCGRGFMAKHTMLVHIQRDHEGVKTLYKRSICDICGKETTVQNMKKHMERVHGLGSMQYVCTICKYNCITEANLKRHTEEIHTEIPCDMCGKILKVGRLKSHKLQNHTEEHLKPFVCTICEPVKGFITKLKYQNHINIHTGSKSYSCDYCQYKCADNSNRLKHMKYVHKDLYKPNPSNRGRKPATHY